MNETLKLLKWAGTDLLNSVLPKPLTGIVRAHSTGCQVEIFATDKGLPEILVWRGRGAEGDTDSEKVLNCAERLFMRPLLAIVIGFIAHAFLGAA